MLIMYLSVYHLGEFLEHLDHIDDASSISTERNLVVLLSTIAIIFIAFFAAIEINQAKQSVIDYFVDYWNYIDVLSLGLNLMFLIMLNTNCFMVSNEIFSKTHIRVNAAVGCFTLWIKLFYWMRLFKVTAYFITLITQTLFDIRVFMIMLTIILIAFGTFFSILNTDTSEFQDVPDGQGYHYVGQYVGQRAIDAVIAMYLLSLGEFDMDGYKEGPHVIFAWLFFLMATFLVLVVFMNMLIAMMGETFAMVQTIQEETALAEQL